jgi:ribosome-associated toxin RatA of RatAB toxin-antitoxin module
MKWLALLSLMTATAVHAEECDGFELALERDGVRVFNRKIDGSAVREMCVTGKVDAPPAEVFDLLRDVESYPQRLPPTVQVERIAESGGATTYYMVIDPGFITRRDYCISTRGTRDGEVYSVVWHQVDCPLRSSRIERMTSNRGSWRVTPVDGGSAILYRTHADPGGLVPAWLVNSASARRLPEIFGALKRALQKVSRR